MQRSRFPPVQPIVLRDLEEGEPVLVVVDSSLAEHFGFVLKMTPVPE